MTTTLQALVFDFDGTIAETERDGHRLAYNAAFDEANVGWEWDVPTYGELLATSGGKERMAGYIARERPEIAAETVPALVERLHLAKQRHFDSFAARLVLRPGIVRLIEEARASGIVVAIATTAALSGVEAILRCEPRLADAFAFIAAGDVVAKKKPAPDIYEYTLERLGFAPNACVAFEDSAIGLRAARSAGLTTIVSPSVYTATESFAGAAAIVSDLGEPGAPARTLAGPIPPRGYVDLAFVRALLATPEGSSPRSH